MTLNYLKTAAAYINLSAFKSNYKLAKYLAQNSKTIAVIKADAYGHGVIPIAKALQTMEDQFDGIAVANVYEGMFLRLADINCNNIVVLQGFNNMNGLESSLKYNLQPVIHTKDQLDLILSRIWPSNKLIWMKFDSGMHRLGFTESDCNEYLNKIINKFGNNGFVFCSHFACSDSENMSYTEKQLQLFKTLVDKYNIQQWSIANSGGIICVPRSHGSFNRAGYMLYGNSPLDYTPKLNDQNAKLNSILNRLEPVMTLVAPVIAIRKLSKGDGVGYGLKWIASKASYVATIAIGYGDGYPRHAPTGTPVLINNNIVKLVGGVCMDNIMVDVTDIIENVKIGDIAVMWGNSNVISDNNTILCVNDVAKHANTIGYDLLTRVMPRLEKKYIKI